MKIKTAELTGDTLDWAVAKSLGYTHYEHDPVDGKVFRKTPEGFTADFRIEDNSFCYDWAQGGPIIEREGITVSKTAHGFWEAYKRPASLQECYQVDATPLIAAMRCYVASKLGSDVEIPDELLV
jgi:hypothetical protein